MATGAETKKVSEQSRETHTQIYNKRREPAKREARSSNIWIDTCVFERTIYLASNEKPPFLSLWLSVSLPPPVRPNDGSTVTTTPCYYYCYTYSSISWAMKTPSHAKSANHNPTPEYS